MNGTPKGPPPAGGDIVTCWFPTDEEPLKRGPKLRPALVVTSESDINGHFLRVAYSTGQRTENKNSAPLPAHFYTIDPAGKLPQQTAFDFSKVMRLPFTDFWFEPWRDLPTLLLCKLAKGQLPGARQARAAGDSFNAARAAAKQKSAPAPVVVTTKPARRTVQIPPKTAATARDGNK